MKVPQQIKTWNVSEMLFRFLYVFYVFVDVFVLRKMNMFTFLGLPNMIIDSVSG